MNSPPPPLLQPQQSIVCITIQTSPHISLTPFSPTTLTCSLLLHSDAAISVLHCIEILLLKGHTLHACLKYVLLLACA